MGTDWEWPVLFKGCEPGSSQTEQKRSQLNRTGLGDFQVALGTSPDITQMWHKLVTPTTCSHPFWAASGTASGMSALPEYDASILGTHSHHFRVMQMHWGLCLMSPRSDVSPEQHSSNKFLSFFGGRQFTNQGLQAWTSQSLACTLVQVCVCAYP